MYSVLVYQISVRTYIPEVFFSPFVDSRRPTIRPQGLAGKGLKEVVVVLVVVVVVVVVLWPPSGLSRLGLGQTPEELFSKSRCARETETERERQL